MESSDGLLGPREKRVGTSDAVLAALSEPKRISRADYYRVGIRK